LISRRNPCGIFESAIHSLNAMTSEYIQKKYPNLNDFETEKIRNEMAIYKFSRKDVVGGLWNFQLNEMKNMMNYMDNSKNHEVIDWEDLILAESDAFMKIYDFLQANKIESNQIHRAKQSFYKNIDKNLLAFHMHNYRAGHALRDGWIFGLPYPISHQITQETLKVDQNNKFIQDFDKHLMNLDINKFSLHDNAKKALKFIESGEEYVPQLDENIKEFSMNKSNIEASNLKEDYITNLEIGSFLKIKKMSRELEVLIPLFKQFELELQKFNSTILKFQDYSRHSFGKLDSNIVLGNKFLGVLK